MTRDEAYISVFSSTEHQSTLGRIEIETADIGGPLPELGILRREPRTHPKRFEVQSSRIRQIWEREIPTSSANASAIWRPDPVTRRIRWLLGDGLDHLETVVVASEERPTRSGTLQETGQSLGRTGTATCPRCRDRQPLSDVTVSEPICFQQHDPDPLHRPLLGPPGP